MAGPLSVVDTVNMTASASTAVIRQWARDNGLTVGERGRLSPQLLAAYASATSPVVEPPRAAVSAALIKPDAPAGPLAVGVQPTPGATGIGRRVVARHT